MDFPDLLSDWGVWLVAIGAAASTIHTYRYQLVLFWLDYLHPLNLNVLTLTDVDVARYLQTLPAHGCKRKDATQALRSFFRFLEGRHRPDNPTRDFKPPRPKSPPAPDLPDTQMRLLVRTAFHQEARRAWAIMLCFATGARVGSLVMVRREDVHLDDPDPWIYFAIAKNDRPYAVALNRQGRYAAAHLLALGHNPLIGVGAAQFRNWLHAAEQAAHLPRMWPHLLRHAFARRTLRQVSKTDGDLDKWRRTMNHADFSQMTRYSEDPTRSTRSAVDWG